MRPATTDGGPSASVDSQEAPGMMSKPMRAFRDRHQRFCNVFDANVKATEPLSSKFSNEQAELAWLEEARRVEERLRWSSDQHGSRFVLTTGNPFRVCWTVIIALMLVYTGTIFIYRLAFIDFRIELADGSSEDPQHGGAFDWTPIDDAITVAFMCDVVFNFFFSYMDEVGQEVVGLKPVMKHYLTTTFVVDIVACLPDEVLTFIAAKTNLYGAVGMGVKSFRLKRLSRLFRLTNLMRLAKLGPFSNSPIFAWFRRQKGTHIIKLGVCLLWMVHIFACGWYICASLHANPETTWVARRAVTVDGERTLLLSTHVDQWMQAMYFTLTVFTTVGFGDMAAMTNGEVAYVCFMMVVGAVVNSIVVSSVIQIVTTNDRSKLFVQKRIDLMDAFAAHTGIDDFSTRQLKSWVKLSARFWMTHEYDRREMRELIAGKYMPSALAMRLPLDLFEGRLIENQLLWVCEGVCPLPPRLPMLLALAGNRQKFKKRDIVYQAQDFAWGIFLVLDGTFSFVEPVPFPAIPVFPSQEISRKTVRITGRSSVLQGQGPTSARGPSFLEEGEPFFPFRLFSSGAYFGDVEMFQQVPRACAVRCETEEGTLLSINKTEMLQLAEDFPAYGARWRLEAKRRRRFFLPEEVSSMVVRCLDYKTLAAVFIQQWWRSGDWRIAAAACKSAEETGLLQRNTPSGRQGLSGFLVPPGLGTETGSLAFIKKEQESMRRDLTALSSCVFSLDRNVRTLMAALNVEAPAPEPEVPRSLAPRCLTRSGSAVGSPRAAPRAAAPPPGAAARGGPSLRVEAPGEDDAGSGDVAVVMNVPELYGSSQEEPEPPEAPWAPASPARQPHIQQQVSFHQDANAEVFVHRFFVNVEESREKIHL